MSWYSPFSYINIAELYLASPYLWDSIIYLMLFLGISTFVFTSKAHYGKKGKPIAIAVGLALAISMTVWTYQQGWNLGSAQVAVLPLTILSFVFFFLFYRLFKDLMEMDTGCAFALSYILMYSGLYAIFEGPLRGAFSRYPSIEALLIIVLLITVVLLFICIFKLFPKGTPGPEVTPGAATPGGGGATPPPGTPPVTPAGPPQNLVNTINELATRAGELDRLKPILRRCYQNLLDANADLHAGPTPALQRMYDLRMRELTQAYQTLSRIVHDSSTYSRFISAHPSQHELEVSHLTALGGSYRSLATSIRDISAMRAVFRRDFPLYRRGPIP